MLLGYELASLAALYLLWRLWGRLRLSRAKHPSLQGHPRMARRLARLLPHYEYDEATFFRCDGAPAGVAASRRAGFARLAQQFAQQAPGATAAGKGIQALLPDAEFTNAYRVPFQFRERVARYLPQQFVAAQSDGPRLTDADGNTAYDLSGSYGVNLFGYEFYKECLAEGFAAAQALGPVLGPYHPVVADNAERLACLSGLDAVSFHMSGTEAVMQAVRLARYHSGRRCVLRFCGSYHGWWDGVQPGVGNRRKVADAYTLREMHDPTLRVLRTRCDIACVLVSPLQALHPNRAAPGDAALVTSERAGGLDREAYTAWLQTLRAVCSARGIALIFDEVFSGFRLARGGAQEYFGVAADMVTYGKTLGGGLPVGVLCGKREWMRRYRPEAPADLCFARGSFNGHPYVMTAMNAFLQRLDTPAIREQYVGLEEALWNARAASLNHALEAEALPLRVVNMVSVWSVIYTWPSRYNWMLQFYMRAHGLALSWTGTGRLIFSHDYSDADFAEVQARFVRAARQMQGDGWWWQSPALTNRAIKRQVLRETIAVRLNPARAAGGLAQSMPLQPE